MEQFEYYGKASKYSKAMWLELSRLPACEHVKYNGSRYWTFVDEIDLARMQHALKVVVNNNWDLRSNFFEQDGDIYLGVRKVVNAKLEYKEMTGAAECRAYIETIIALPFDLERDNLFRFHVIKNITNKQTTLLFVFCHMITDGTVVENIARQVEQAYVEHVHPAAEGKDSTGLAILQDFMAAEELEATDTTGVAYWVSNLAGKTLTNELPRESGGRDDEFKVIQASKVIQGETYRKIKHFCAAHKVSLFNVMQALTGLVVCRYAGAAEAVISYPVNMRGQYKELKGFCVNELPYVFAETGTFLEQVQTLRREIPPRAARKTAAWELSGTVYGKDDHLNVALSNSLPNKFDFSRIGPVSENVLVPNVGQSDLAVAYAELTDGIELTALSVVGVLTKDMLAQIVNHFEWLAEKVTSENQDETVSIPLLTPTEYDQIVCEWNQTEIPFSQPKILHKWFEKQAETRPDNIAVVYKARQLTYYKLNEQANKTARAIQRHYPAGNTTDQLIGMYLDRSPEMITGILGILKCGGAYVPIDPSEARDRLEYKLTDAACKVIITDKQNKAALQDILDSKQRSAKPIVLCLNEDSAAISKLDGSNLDTGAQATDLAYVIYTSGSTGMPKGVMIEHRSIVNTIADRIAAYNFTDHERVILFAKYVFDASVEQIFITLCSGSSLFLTDEQTLLSKEDLENYLRHQAITHLDVTPSFLALIDTDTDYSLRRIVVGGEECPLALLQKWQFTVPVYNNYGPTESAVNATSICYDRHSAVYKVSIGKPIANTFCYIVDSCQRPVPLGAAGELCIGGAGLARGYWNNPQLTAEKFVPNPFVAFQPGSDEQARMYKTGDLCRFLPDGAIEFFGRTDFQVKIRGFRIELGEIENILQAYDGISLAVVAAHENQGVKYLAGYYTTTTPDTDIDQHQLEDYLSSKLPDYMIPAHLMRLEAMPFNTSGKIDRKKLPAPEFAMCEREYVAPQNALEEKLCAIWAETLRVDKVGITDDFFTLGGDSLQSIQLSSRMRKAGIEASVKDVFAYRTISRLATVIDKEAAASDIPSEFTSKTIAKQAYYPLTENQLGLYYEWEKDRTALQYNIPHVSTFSRHVDPWQLQCAVEKVIAAHPYLKTFLVMRDGQAVQFRNDDAPVTIPLAAIKEPAIEELKNTFVQPFDLFTGPLYRIAIYYTDKHTYLFVDIHHIIVDGIALDVFMTDLAKAYEGAELTPESYTAFDYALAEAQLAGSETYRDAEQFFDSRLTEGMTELPQTATGKEKAAATSNVAVYVRNSEIRAFCQKTAVTPGNLFLAALCLVLSRYTREDRIAVTTVSSGRNDMDLENMMGMLVKTLPFVIQISNDKQLAEYVKAIQDTMIETMAHEIYPFTKMAEKHKIAPQISYVYQGGLLETVKLAGEATVTEQLALNKAKFPVALAVTPKNDGFQLDIEYNTSFYSNEYITSFAKAIAACANQLAGHPDWLCKTVSLVDEEQQALLASFNQTAVSFPNPCGTIIEMFKQQVERVPDNIAVVFEENTYTYKALDEITDKLARKLKTLGFGAEQVVGVLIDRSEWMVIYPLAVLKAGGAYMPLDPTFPSDRLNFMLTDAGVKIILSEPNKVADHIPQFDGIVVTPSDLALATVDDSISLPLPAPQDMFVILYTSGSTGLPKGCVLEHHNLTNYCQWHQAYFSVTENDRSGAYANFAFDAHMLDIYPFLTCGAAAYIIPAALRLDFISLNRYFEANRISITLMTTQLGRQFVEQIGNKSLRALLVGGEKLLPVKKPPYAFYNLYGPTECTIAATAYEIQHDYDSAIIGKPLTNCELYVLDASLQLVPAGVPGELCIGGDGVGRGYLNRDEVTAEKFIVWNENRIYRTGDLVRWTVSGEIEYLGRMDGQIKLRGLRIELGEIESHILSYEGITNCAAAVKTIGGTEHLCAYYTADSDIDIDQLKQYLAAKLTAFMIPSAFTCLAALPLTSNGKVNRKALPEPVIARQEIVLPQTETQQQLFDLIATILNANNFGITDDLFSAGLTSILAIKLSVAIYKQFGVNVKTNEIFTNKTILQLEQLLSKATQVEQAAAFAKQAYYPLTENQLGLYYEWEKDRTALQYNIPQVSTFSRQVDPVKLHDAVEKVIAAHPYLKTYLAMRDGQVVQLRNDDTSVTIELAELTEQDIAKRKETFVKPFDLFTGPLYRIAVYYTDTYTYLFLDIHHIIIDGTALGVFMADLAKAYGGEQLAAETYTAFDYALEEAQLAGSVKYAEAEQFFDSRLSRSMTELPRVTTVSSAYQTGIATVPVSGDSITGFCQQHAVTPSNLFLAALCLTLSRYTREEQVAITAASSGRNENKLHAIMGMLVKTLPVVVDIKGSNKITDYVKAVQDNMFATLANEIYPFTKMVEKHKIAPQINYVYQGGMLENLELAGQPLENEVLALNKAKFPLAVTVVPVNGNYEILIEYDTSLYPGDYITIFTGAIAACAKQLAGHPDWLCKAVSLADDEQQALLASFNQTAAAYSNPCNTIVEMFKQTARQTPERIAVVYEENPYTYGELDAITDKLARKLKALGVGAEQVVGVLIDRSEWMVIYPLAVLKAGGAYMPLDPTFPSDRLSFMLTDAAVQIILSEQNKVTEHIPQFSGTVITPLELELTTVDNSLPLPLPAPQDMFVILYTSGSTGMPKGCILDHHNLTNYCKWYQAYYSVTKNDRSAAYANFAFDAHMLDIYPFITCGASTYIIPSAMRLDFVSLNRYFEANHISIAFMTTQLGRQFAEQFDNKSLRALLVGGEKLLPVKKPPYAFYNVYGPTECTLFTTSHEINHDYDSAIIGKPLANYQLYVLDDALQLVPAGVAGELCVGGAGVGRGYLNRDDVTAEKFIVWNGKRIYRTGDLVRWTENGEIEYIGRMDGQIKLRGLRIELGEIEAHILSYEGIISCAAAVKTIGGTEHLCGYYTADSDVDTDQLKQYLATKLTAFMIPTTFTRLTALPLTSNGKVNRKALPEPELQSRTEYVAPTTELEAHLCQVFAETLQLDQVGITDSFFDLGGTSLLVMKVVVKAMALNMAITYGNVFACKTPQKLAAFLGSQVKESSVTDITNYDYTPIDHLLAKNTLGEITEKPLGDILLTGATGFLGIHVLREFLDNYPGKVYCLMRSHDSHSADTRLKVRLVYYFDHDYADLFGNRLFTVEGDITAPASLTVKVDTVINCAAIVKHFAVGDELEKANAESVRNLIQYCRDHEATLIQISTASVAGTGDETLKDHQVTESQLYVGQLVDNKYVHSKFLAERYVLEAAATGLQAKIMRVGNLMARNQDGEFQLNFQGNSFMNSLKSYKLLEAFPVTRMSQPAEFSPIDSTAKAVLKLAQSNSEYTVFHPYNNHAIYMADVIYAMKEYGFSIDIVSEEKFAECLREKMQDETIMPALTGILAYQDNDTDTPVYGLGTSNQFTTEVLYRLNFVWPVTSEFYIKKAVEALDSLGFFDIQFKAE